MSQATSRAAMTGTEQLPDLLARARNAQARDDHATYCACWGRIDRVLDRMLEAPGEDPRSNKTPPTRKPPTSKPPVNNPHP